MTGAGGAGGGTLFFFAPTAGAGGGTLFCLAAEEVAAEGRSLFFLGSVVEGLAADAVAGPLFFVSSDVPLACAGPLVVPAPEEGAEAGLAPPGADLENPVCSYAAWTATTAAGGGGIPTIVPLSEGLGAGAAASSGTSLARCHLGMPARHTSVVGGRTPLPSAARSSSI